MAINMKFTGEKEEERKVSFNTTEAAVKCINPETGKLYEKHVSINGLIENEMTLMNYLFTYRDRYLAIKEKTPAGNTTAFLAMPVQILSMKKGSVSFKISFETAMKYGRRDTEKEAEETEEK